MILNASVEEELLGRAPNDDIDSSENLDTSFGIVADVSGSRGAVLGHVETDNPDFYRLSLDADQSLNVSLTADAPGELALDLYDSSGEWLASGIERQFRRLGIPRC